MRLAVFVNQFPSKVSTFFARDIRAWMEAGLDIEIFSLYPYEPDLWRFVPDILNGQVLPRERVHHLTLHQCLNLASEKGLLRRFISDAYDICASSSQYGVVPLAKAIYACLKGWGFARQIQQDFDHILAYWGNYTASCAYIFQRLTNPEIPFSTFLHADIDLYDDQAFLKQKLLYAAHIIVVCDFNRNFVQKLYPDIYPQLAGKFHLHHTALDFAQFPFKPDPRPPRKVIAVGRLAKTKGYDYLLRAVQVLVRKGFEVDLEMVGDGEEARALRNLSRRLGIEDHVHFSGWLPINEVKKIMIGATILVHPSPDLGDAVPTVIKEAMALGTPVIATPIAGIPELLDHGNCGLLVPPKDVNALAEAIENLLSDASLRKHYAISARRYAEEHFDVWRNGRRLVNILAGEETVDSSEPGVSHKSQQYSNMPAK